MHFFVSSLMVFITLTSVFQVHEGSKLNQSCEDKDTCGWGYMCATNKTCQCAKFYILSKNYDKCIGGVGQKCKYDDDCVDGAFCENQTKCRCKEDFYSADDGLACSMSPKLFPTVLFYIVVMHICYILKNIL